MINNYTRNTLHIYMTEKKKAIYVLNTYAQKENKKSISDKMIGTRKYIIYDVSMYWTNQ